MMAIEILRKYAKEKHGLDSDKELVIFGCRGIEIRNNEFYFNQNPIDSWDDSIIFLSQEQEKTYLGTVDPGLYFMNQPMNSDGTGRVEPGVLWFKRGIHKTYKALIQARPVVLMRDSNRDHEFGNEDKLHKGMFAINLHGASGIDKVGRSSAGCVVVKLLSWSKEFKELMAWIYGHEQKEFPCVILDHKSLSLFIGGMK
jgi:hypothetical protein